MAKTSLEKSHSKVSNFKLTNICLFLACGICMIFVGLALLKQYKTYSIIGISVGSVLSLLMLILLNKFAR